MSNKQKAKSIEEQLREFEARLQRQMLREKLDSLAGAFDSGAMPQIHVTLGQLAASRPAVEEREFEGLAGDPGEAFVTRAANDRGGQRVPDAMPRGEDIRDRSLRR